MLRGNIVNPLKGKNSRAMRHQISSIKQRLQEREILPWSLFYCVRWLRMPCLAAFKKDDIEEHIIDLLIDESIANNALSGAYEQKILIRIVGEKLTWKNQTASGNTIESEKNRKIESKSSKVQRYLPATG